MIIKASFFVEEFSRPVLVDEDDADNVLVAEMSSCEDSPEYVWLTIGGNPPIIVYVRDLEAALDACTGGTGEL